MQRSPSIASEIWAQLSLRAILSAVGGVAMIAMVSCGEPVAPTAHEALHAGLMLRSADVDPGLVADVHAATAAFHSTVQASEAGYAQASPCVSHPTLGTMGFHWVKTALVDPVFDPLEPEALVYAPHANGSLRLVAIEYIVVDVGQPAPTFDGYPFAVRGSPLPVPHWTLHVWTHQTNPSGIFSPWNPAVSCTP